MRPARQLQAYLRMRREGRLPADELARLQDARVRLFVAHAYERVPFVRDLFAANRIEPGDIRGARDLERIPVMTKAGLQAMDLDRLLARGAVRERLVRVSTSGSTGVPLKLYFAPSDFSRMNMNWFRAQMAWGIRPFHRALEITGPHNIAARRPWYQRLGLWRKEPLSLFEPVEAWVEWWNRLKPDILYGYSRSLALLAQHVLERGGLRPLPRFVVGVSELCTELEADLIRRAFGREIIDLYGAAEAGCIAWKCPTCRGYHLNADSVVVEVCRDGQPVRDGEPGSVIVTNLFSRAMPILRYDLGDMARMSPDKPACGLGLPLLEIVEGRADDRTRTPAGRTLSPLFFFSVMKGVPGLKAWRVIQDEAGSFTVLFVPAADAPADLGARLGRRVVECIGEPVRVEARGVEAIAPEPSGKVRSVISRVGEKS